MTIAVIGAGVIGGAIAKSLLRSKYKGRIIATRREIEKIRDLEESGVIVTRDNKKAAEEADIIIICVKPKNVEHVLREINEKISGKLVISVAAAVPLSFLKNIVPEARFVRAMPNVAVLVQEAFTAYCADPDVTPENKEKVEEILGMMGGFMEVEEKYMDAITGLSGSSPAYLSIMIEALMYAGLKVGLPRDIALFSSAQSMIGIGRLILETKKHPAEIKDMVVTPGGVTIEGIYELENVAIRPALMKAVEATTIKSKVITESLMTK